MQAIILAAGVGRRLGRFTQQHPKSLLSFGYLTLIERHLLHLETLGCEKITIVTGHLADQIEALVGTRASYLFNPDYELGSALSLLVAAPVLEAGPCLMMDADILCDRYMFERLLLHPAADCLLVDGRLHDSGEEVKAVGTADGRVLELGKQIVDQSSVLGESVGIFKFSAGTAARLVPALRAAVAAQPRIEYEPVFNGLLAEVQMMSARVDDLPWTEIDFAEDVLKAQAEVLPLLSNTDALLFTPGPLTTSVTVKAAMLHDAGSRDARFIRSVRDVRQTLLDIAGVRQAGYEAVLLQGSGTYAVESVLSSLTPPQGRWLFLVNGAYGQRMRQIAQVLGLSHAVVETAEDQPVTAAMVETALDATITHVGVVHCETTTGLLNPIEAIGRVVRSHHRFFMVDAMSSFGGLPVPMADIDCLVTSANKCLAGVPGLGIVLCRRSRLEEATRWARSLSLDIVDQWRRLEADGQFRFTPPTHVLLALARALREFQAEGGLPARTARYRRNQQVLLEGMTRLGFDCLLAEEHQSPIITTFLSPPNFNFEAFYQGLSRRGFTIYPGKLSQRDSFRIGTIGHLFDTDMARLLKAVEQVVADMQSQLR